ncbi:uncharacterized protein LOC129270936 [Lytechinus pictus]|uniref:uncharacterized protein LOC129270936 n=1 Tax=Lytechinus pictus TaxID=7653 RepID=UPI0030B9ED66
MTTMMMMASMTSWSVLFFWCFVVNVISVVPTVSALSDPSIQDDVRFQHQFQTKGRRFAFAFIDNGLKQHIDLDQGPKLTITALPGGPQSIRVNVSMPLLGFFESVSIVAGSQVNVQLPLSAIAHGIGLHDNGVQVEASEDVIVYGIAEEGRHAKTEGFLALPVPDSTSTGSDYTVVALEQKKDNARRHSTFAVVAVEACSVTVDAVATITYGNVTYQPRETLNVTLEPYQVLQIKSSSDLTGTRVHSTSPVGFMSGVDCGTMKLRKKVKSSCGHLVEQLPRKKDWGQHFIYRTLNGGPSTRRSRDQTEPVDDVITRIKIIPAEDDTHIVYGTDKERVGNDPDFVISGSETIHITATKPVLVVAFVLYHGACERCKKISPTMVTIPPLAQPANGVIFSTVNATERRGNAEISHLLSVIYDCACFRRLTWENPGQTEVVSEGFAAITDQVCWNQFRVTPGRYHLTATPDQTSSACFLSAFLFGHGTNGGYGFPLGLDRSRNTRPAERTFPTSAVGSEFFVAFAAYFRGNRRGPKLFIHRASSADDDRPIRGQIDAGSYSFSFVIPVGTPSIEIELLTTVVLYDTRSESAHPVEVRTQGQVLVYGLNDAFSDERSDAFLALPTPMMGQQYRLVTSYENTIFVIIGIYDDTFVNLDLKGSLWFRNHVHYGGTRAGFKIRRHQALFFMSVEHQTGTHVVASKPISVLSGATCGHSYYPDNHDENDSRCGHKLEHLPPVERWGRRFVASAWRGYGGGEVTTYVMASSKHTKLRIDNGEDEVQIPPGHTYRLYQGGTRSTHTLITSNQPVLVYQVPNSRNLTHSSGYSLPSLTIVPSVDEPAEHDQSLRRSIPLPVFNLRRRNTTTSFANVVAPCAATSNITLNGHHLEPSEWSGPIAQSDLCVMRKQLQGDDNSLDAGGAKVSVVLYGFSPASGYSCPGNM